MKRLLCLATALALLSACSPSDSGSLGPAPTGAPRSATPSPSSSPSPTTTASPEKTITIEVWFTRAGKVLPTSRTRPATIATSRLALTELVAGPSTVEAEAGVGSDIVSTSIFDIRGITDGVATVNFPAPFYAGGTAVARLRQAQVVYTLTQFPTVSRVGFQSAGQPAGAPVGRADYADLLAPIVVNRPAIGQRISSPVTVSGSANVFEATVSVRILDATGKEIAAKFTTATCGSGCRGTYSVTVSYQGCVEQAGIVEVFEVSGENGSRINIVDVPVTLSGCTS